MDLSVIVEKGSELVYKPDRILEMSRLAEDALNVPIDPRIDVAALTAGDENPMFVNVEIIRSGTSKTNRRVYTPDVIKELMGMIPGTQGFLGHPDPSKHGFEFREPQCVFVGAKLLEQAGASDVKIVSKAYIFMTSSLREWIPKSIAAGNPLTVSINAIGNVVKDGAAQLLHVKRFTELQSIDWANPGTEGFGTSKALSVVSEMQGGDPKMELNETLKGVRVSELRNASPDLVGNLIADVTIAELQARNPKVVAEIQESAKLTEMSLKVNGEEKVIKLADVQSVVDAKDSKITEMQGVIDGYTAKEKAAEVSAMKTALITEMVGEAYREAVAKRVSGDTKEALTASITAEVAFITELAGSAGIVNKTIINPVIDFTGKSAAEIGGALFGSTKKTK